MDLTTPVASDSDPEQLEAWLERLRKGNPLLDEDALAEALQRCKSDEQRQLLHDFWNAARKADADDSSVEPSPEMSDQPSPDNHH